MVSDVVDVDIELAHPKKRLWELLVAPQWFPRFFHGIGTCDRIEDPGTAPAYLARIGVNDHGITEHRLQVVVGRPEESLELVCPDLGSFVSIRLSDTESGNTRIVATFFKAANLHPTLAVQPNNVVGEWTRHGLGRIGDFIDGKPTSVAANGDDFTSMQMSIAKQMVSTGVVRTYRPDRGLKQLSRLAKWGFTLAGGYAAAAAHSPKRIALIDNSGTALTFGEIHERTHSLAGAFGSLGFGARSKIGLLARNHIQMVEAMAACGKVGADVVLLNTGLSSRQLEEIAQRHGLSAVIADEEFEPQIQYLPAEIVRFSTARTSIPGRISIDDLVGQGPGTFAKPAEPGRLVVLTSGTSGTPKGARRPQPKGFGTVAALLSRIPLRMNEMMLVPSPLFHTWGLAALQISTPIRATVVLQDKFDAEECLRAIAEHKVTTLMVVPIMLNRILDLPVHVRARYDTSSLKVVASCGAPLAGPTVLRFMDTFGDVLYNVYGSTEVSWGTIAGPADLRAAPTTAGRPPLGTKVAILDPEFRPVPRGAVGRIFVGSHFLFDGYTDATPPAEADGMLDTGDLGYFDAEGRLFVAGRDDEMIISGGENVFPLPVEEALSHLPQVREVAVMGVPDNEFGQRLAAFVVTRDGFRLDQDMVRSYIHHRLSRFSVPRDVTFVPALPRSATGKVLKRLLIQAG